MKLERLAIVGVFAAILTSCMTAKQYTYFNDMVVNDSYPIRERPEIKLQPGDIVNISVSSSDPQLAVPFNMTEALNIDALITDYSMEKRQNTSIVRGYLIDEHGYIEFPVLGDLRLSGMTLAEVKEMIRAEIVAGGYIKEPIVKVDIKNFEYTIITSRGNAGGGSGTFTVEGNNMTLLKALARGSVLTNNQKLDDIRVIRTEGNVRKVYSVNILKKEFFDSPVFYLQQNDIIYVQPRGGRLTPEAQFAWSMAGTIISGASLITSLAILANNLLGNKE